MDRFDNPSSSRPRRPRLAAALDAVHELARSRYGEALTLADLALAADLPPNTLTRTFNNTYGMSPMRWLWSFRTLLAAELIAAAPEWSLTDIATYCGFNSSAHFSRRFREMFRECPSRFRANFPRPGAGGPPTLERLEAQDAVAAQAALVKLAARARARSFLVADPDKLA